MPVCKIFSSKSGCVRGDRCYYQHVQLANQEQLESAISPPNFVPAWRITDSSPTGPAKAPLSGFPDPLAEVSCHFFNIGVCKNGDRCRFRYKATSEEEIEHGAILQQARNNRLYQGSANTNRMYQRHSLQRLLSQMLEI